MQPLHVSSDLDQRDIVSITVVDSSRLTEEKRSDEVRSIEVGTTKSKEIPSQGLHEASFE